MKKEMNNRIVYIMMALVFAALAGQAQEGKVYVAGELRKIMHQHDIGAKVSLDTLQDKPDLYAVGALDSLDGEILIEGGRSFVSRVKDGEVEVFNDFSHKATLLVYAQVSKWQEMDLPDSIRDAASLAAFLAELVSQKGLNAPFAFRLEGVFDSVAYHVITNTSGKNANHRERHEAAYKGELKQEKAYITGFWSDSHHGIFTHHGSDVHMHVRNEPGDQAGHIDHLVIGNSIKLFIPVL